MARRYEMCSEQELTNMIVSHVPTQKDDQFMLMIFEASIKGMDITQIVKKRNKNFRDQLAGKGTNKHSIRSIINIISVFSGKKSFTPSMKLKRLILLDRELKENAREPNRFIRRHIPHEILRASLRINREYYMDNSGNVHVKKSFPRIGFL